MRNDGKPRSGAFRLMLPADADWSTKKTSSESQKTTVVPQTKAETKKSKKKSKS